jgi:hypothetical protein
MKTKEQYLAELELKFPSEVLILRIKHCVYDSYQEIDLEIYNLHGALRNIEISKWAIKELADKFSTKLSPSGNIDTGRINFSPYLYNLPDIGFSIESTDFKNWHRNIYKYEIKDLEDLKNKISEVLSLQTPPTIKKFKDLYE